MFVFKKESVDLDKTDLATLRSFVEKSQIMVFAKAQILESIDEAKEKKEITTKKEKV